jgi:hypothetical protein
LFGHVALSVTSLYLSLNLSLYLSRLFICHLIELPELGAYDADDLPSTDKKVPQPTFFPFPEDRIFESHLAPNPKPDGQAGTP